MVWLFLTMSTCLLCFFLFGGDENPVCELEREVKCLWKN